MVGLALLHLGKWLERVTLWAGGDVSRESPAEIKEDWSGGKFRLRGNGCIINFSRPPREGMRVQMYEKEGSRIVMCSL